jgi:hypothetical protein
VGRTWRPRRVAITIDVIAFAAVDEDTLLDAIPLSEVLGIESLDQKDVQQQQPKNSFEKPIDFTYAFQIRTMPDGQNAGRKYFLHADSDEQVAAFTKQLGQLSRAASDRAASRSRWAKAQRTVRAAYTSDFVQSVAALLIIGVCLARAESRQPRHRFFPGALLSDRFPA